MIVYGGQISDYMYPIAGKFNILYFFAIDILSPTIVLELTCNISDPTIVKKIEIAVKDTVTKILVSNRDLPATTK